MATIETAQVLKRAGRFGEALTALKCLPRLELHRPSGQVLLSELLMLTGAMQEARRLAVNLLNRPQAISLSQRSSCEYVLGRVAREDACVDVVVNHLQRSISLAHAATDLASLCRAQLTLMIVLADLNGPDAIRPLASDVRANVTRLGDRHITAMLHVVMAELEAKQAHFRGARRHAQLALDILKPEPNCWLQARAETMLFVVDLLWSDLHTGEARGFAALRLADEAQHATLRRNCLGNLGNYFHFTGQYEKAVQYFQRSLSEVHVEGSRNNANIESLARVYLTQGRLAECESLIDAILASAVTEAERQLYVYRYTELTKTTLLARQGRLHEAVDRVDLVLSLAQRTGDVWLENTALLLKAEFFVDEGKVDDCAALVEGAGSRTVFETPELYARYEQVLARASAEKGHEKRSAIHHFRALRLARSIRNVPIQTEIERSWAGQSSSFASVPGDVPTKRPTFAMGAQAALETLSALTLNTGRLEFIARELVTLLAATEWVHAAEAIARFEDVRDCLESVGDPTCVPADVPTRTIRLGWLHDREIIVVVRPKGDVESIAGLNAVTMFVSALRELEHARAESEERARLWPTDEILLDGDDSVISGHMRELMTYAQKIARVKVNVLITGESGTGKEILARALHSFSDRAQKPFVPFNCTAVPRDLLESQLFGHRRGAFTGADRDHLGIIRSARGGTLFLDEIGELGLDLQPKLLRFLESGEIATLGELEPKTTDVRIVAATNTNLEDAVRAGRFREDLFYRLNVVRLSVRPLRERRDEIPAFVHHFARKAAEEFQKGRITIADETMERLIIYRWPGNVRQLQNEVRRLVALAEPNSAIQPDAIDESILGTLPVFNKPRVNGTEVSVSLKAKLLPTLGRIECEMIRAALKDHGGRVNAAAKALGISRKGLYLKRQRFGL